MQRITCDQGLKMSQVGSLVSSLLRGHSYYPLIKWDNPPSTPWAPDARSIIPEGWAFPQKKQMVIGQFTCSLLSYIFIHIQILNINIYIYTNYTDYNYCKIKYKSIILTTILVSPRKVQNLPTYVSPSYCFLQRSCIQHHWASTLTPHL